MSDEVNIDGFSTIKCPRCGRRVTRLVMRNGMLMCSDCLESVVLADESRLRCTVTSCATALANILIDCTQVILSEGQDKEAMARALKNRDCIAQLDKALKLREFGKQ